MGFPMIDQPTTDISRYFYIASKFIENGINSGGLCTFSVLSGIGQDESSNRYTPILLFFYFLRSLFYEIGP
jgi:hypothetical protein